MFAYPLKLPTISTRVLEAGTGGTPLVFVHGTGGRADRWERNLDAMAAAGYHAYAFDLPGHGFASKGPGVDCSVPGYRQVLGGFLEAIGVREPAVIVGTSLGGHVVASFACEQPNRVKAIALVGSMGLIPIGAEARQRVQKGANNQSRDGVVEKFKRVIFDPANVSVDLIEGEYRINNSAGAKESFETLGNYIAQRLDDDAVGDALGKLAGRFPVLLVWGDQDKVVPLSVGEAAKEKLPGSRLVVIKDTAHTPYFEKAEAFNAVLGEFLAGKTGTYRSNDVSYR